MTAARVYSARKRAPARSRCVKLLLLSAKNRGHEVWRGLTFSKNKSAMHVYWHCGHVICRFQLLADSNNPETYLAAALEGYLVEAGIHLVDSIALP